MNSEMSCLNITVTFAFCYGLKAGVPNTRPARGSNAAREHREKLRFLKILSNFAYFFQYIDFSQIFIKENFTFPMRPSRPLFESNAALDSLEYETPALKGVHKWRYILEEEKEQMCLV